MKAPRLLRAACTAACAAASAAGEILIDGGANARLYTRPTTNGGNDAFRRGSGSASLSNKKGDASSIFTRDLTAEVSFFGEIKVKFWAYVFSFEKDEGFFPRVHHGRDDLDRRCAIHQQ